jgi:hypothetical protein
LGCAQLRGCKKRRVSDAPLLNVVSNSMSFQTQCRFKLNVVSMSFQSSLH